MASRSWSMGYALARVQNALEHAVGHLTGSASAGYASALRAGFEALRAKELTTVVCMSGPAMLPTLNKLQEPSAGQDRLLMRALPRPAGSVFLGDVVAFRPPPGAAEGSLLVRRIAALEGEEMVSDDPADTAFSLPSGHCWVLADNEELQAAAAGDSRSFGPLPVDAILGRILYFVRTASEHGPVDNSAQSAPSDQAVLEAELDVEKLLHAQC